MTFPIFYDGLRSTDFDEINSSGLDDIPTAETREVIKKALDAELLRRATGVDQ